MVPRRAGRSLLVSLVVITVAGLLLFAILAGPDASPIGTGVLGPLGGLGLLVAVAVASAVVVGVIWWIVLRRIERLNNALRDVADGDFDQTLYSRSADEIGELTDSINAMILARRDDYEELRTNDELRRRLVANVSHELRTPLTNIQGYLETARLAGPGSPDFARNLEICQRETRKLIRLVQDLFELSKLDTQQLEFHFETVSLVELADQVGLAFEQRMTEKEIEFETQLPSDPLEVVADGNRLGQVITNLLGNAVVFTPPGGRVTLTCERVGDRAVCRVADTGIGIGEKDLPHIFESFFHLEKSRTRNLGGTGLGLAICKAIVDAHEGKMDVVSREGQGTTFSFELDLAPPTDDDVV